MVCFINKHINNFCLACKKWCKIFKCSISLIVCIYCWISCNWNKCIRIITKAWFNTFCLKFYRIILVLFIFCCLIVYNIPFFVANLDSSLLESFKKYIIFCVYILIDTHRILWKFRSCFFWFFSDENHYWSIIFAFANKINLFL